MRSHSLAHALIEPTEPIAGHIARLSLKKNLGAFYTGRSAADRLVTWAVKEFSETVLDPIVATVYFLKRQFQDAEVLEVEIQGFAELMSLVKP